MRHEARLGGWVNLALLLAGVFAHTEFAVACSDNQYQQCTGDWPPTRVCVCLDKVNWPPAPPKPPQLPNFPTCGGFICDGIQHVVDEAKAQAFGDALANWIQQSRNTAIGGAQSIPPVIRQALTGYIDEDAMNRVRYKVGDMGVLNLANLTMNFGQMFTGLDANAVTLIDVIVFRTADDAIDASLWAHELTHVAQYRDWGVRDFGIRYARNSNKVEAMAYAKGDNFSSWYSQTHGATSFNAASAGWPAGYQTANCGCWGLSVELVVLPSTPRVTIPDSRCQSGSSVATACASIGSCPGMITGPYQINCQ